MLRLPLTPAAELTLAAALLMALGVGTRSSFGLFVSPLNTNTGLGLAAIGLAAAFGQLAWGAAAPLVGWLADRFDARRLIAGLHHSTVNELLRLTPLEPAIMQSILVGKQPRCFRHHVLTCRTSSDAD